MLNSIVWLELFRVKPCREIGPENEVQIWLNSKMCRLQPNDNTC